MPLAAVSANDVDAGGLSIDLAIPVAWLDAELAEAEARARAPGKLTARLSRTGNEIVVRGRVAAHLSVPCARCLDPAETAVDAELSLLLVPAKSEAPPRASGRAGAAKDKTANGSVKKGKPDETEHEFTSADADVDTYDGEIVLLDPFVREAILLEIPNFPLCSEVCPGIRPAEVGPSAEPAAPRIDPRLAPLGALRAKLSGARAADTKNPPAKAKAKKRTKE